MDDTAYRQRAAQVSQIEAMFSEFGPQISSYMLTQALMPGGIRRLTMRLEMSSRGRDGADMAQICQWIHMNGIEAFCLRVGLRFGAASVPPSDRPTPTGGKTTDSTDPRLRVRPLDPTQSDSASRGHDPKTPGLSRSSVVPADSPTGQKPGADHKQKVAFRPVSLTGKPLGPPVQSAQPPAALPANGSAPIPATQSGGTPASPAGAAPVPPSSKKGFMFAPKKPKDGPAPDGQT